MDEKREDREQGRGRGRRASVELIRARAFEELSRWNALERWTHHERVFESRFDDSIILKTKSFSYLNDRYRRNLVRFDSLVALS